MKLTNPLIILAAGGALAIAAAWVATAPNDPDSTSPPSDSKPAESPPSITSAPRATQATTPPEDADAGIKAIISKRLKDPKSARFQNIRHLSNVEVCGEVNSKNSFGGYSGFNTFWINDITLQQPVVMIDTSDTSIAATACHGR